MKSNTFKRLAVAVTISAVALAGVSTPAMAQSSGKKVQRVEKAEKDQTVTVSPKPVRVKRGVKGQVPAAEPVPINQDHPTIRRTDRTARPVVRQPKAPKNTVRVPNNSGPVVVQRAEKPNKFRRPAPVPIVEDNVIVRNPVRVNPTVRPSDAVLPRTDRTAARQVRVPDQVLRARVSENRSQLSTYNQYLIRQQRIADQRQRELRLQRRLAQARYMEDYWRRLAMQQQQVNSWQSYNYNNDPYFYTPANYRYEYGGSYYETNQWGASLLEQSINEGYREGFYAGQADREDSWRYSYQNSYAYQDANWGYNGLYVSQSTYNHYFRQGFQRGYEDGYYSRNQYGRNNNGTLAILGAVLGTILVLEALDDN